ncbi:MAG: metallophosphoesterase [Pseudomonadales bacterium]
MQRPEMRRLFLSDLHLDDPEDARFATFAAELARQAPAVDEIYLLGDLCEVWIGDDDDGPLAEALMRCLAAATRQARVFLMRGNRDFLIGERFATRTGCELIDDPTLLDGRMLLTCGR